MQYDSDYAIDRAVQLAKQIRAELGPVDVIFGVIFAAILISETIQTVAEAIQTVAETIHSVGISPNVADSNLEPANLVDAVAALNNALANGRRE